MRAGRPFVSEDSTGDGLGADMEREEGGRAEALRGRDKILCYINMQSPGRSQTPTWREQRLIRWPQRRD